MKEKKLQNTILRQFATRPELRLWRANVGMSVPPVMMAQVSHRIYTQWLAKVKQ